MSSHASASARPSGWGARVLIGIVVAYVGILILWPIVALVRGAFAEGLPPFVRALSDPEVLRAFGLTLALAAATVLVNAFFGTIVAWVLVRQRFTGRGFLNGLIDLPFVVSPVIAGYMLILLFGRRGWFAPLVEATGIKVVFALPGMLLATIFVALPFVIRELMPVLEEVGTELEQAAATLGASGRQIFWRVTLPEIRWGLLYGITLTLGRALGEFGAVLVVGGAVVGRTETATLYIFRALDERMYVGAYAASLVLALISVVVLLGMEQYRRKTEDHR